MFSSHNLEVFATATGNEVITATRFLVFCSLVLQFLSRDIIWFDIDRT